MAETSGSPVFWFIGVSMLRWNDTYLSPGVIVEPFCSCQAHCRYGWNVSIVSFNVKFCEMNAKFSDASALELSRAFLLGP
ncbi:hypothetical protein AB3X96_03525 [Paraburkholderia sp. BR13439]|uniref:hypothetical protein n=1 Tax=Paraburkholderia TaxID=1822464 RepID=UPI0034CF7456